MVNLKKYNNILSDFITLDSAGNVRSVAPKPVIEPDNHRIFDANGNYMGRR